MPRLKLRINIGIPDARRLGLDPAAAREGSTIDVADEAAAELLRRGWAEEPPAGGPAVGLKAIPPVDLRADADGNVDDDDDDSDDDGTPDLESMTKDELKAYADEYGIPGVTTHLTKAEMVELIRRAIS